MTARASRSSGGLRACRHRRPRSPHQVRGVVHPGDLGARHNLAKGATHGLSHRLTQMAYLRPSNRHRRYRNLYFVGSEHASRHWCTHCDGLRPPGGQANRRRTELSTGPVAMPERVVLVSPRGFCAGVVRAIATVERALGELRAPGLRAPRDRAQRTRQWPVSPRPGPHSSTSSTRCRGERWWS